MNTFKRLPALMVMVSAVALSLAAIAIADTITGDANSITANIDGSVEVAAGGSGAGKFALVVNDNSTDTRNGCNANATNPVVLAVSSNQSWLTLTQSTITVSDCDSGTTADGLQNAAAVNFSVASGAPAGATATVTATYQSGGRGGTYAPGSFQVKTPAAPADSIAPTSSASAKNADNSAYTFGAWTKQNVSVTLSGSDNSGGSGLKEIRYTTNGTDPTATTGTVYSAPFTITTEGTTTVKWRAVDNVGNLEAAQTRTVKIDKTAPDVNCGSADGVWHAADAAIACTATDASSGVAPASDESFSLHTNVAAGTESSNASTGSKTVSDAAGNNATAGPVGGNKVDKKGPGVSCDSADGSWHAADVSIDCTATDGGSGVAPQADEGFSLSTNVAGGTETSNAQTNSKTVSDAVGNTTTAGPVGGNKVDKKGPGVSCDSADGSWHAADVSIDCTATDGGSGVAPQTDEGFSLSTNVAVGTETNNAQTSSKTVSDAVGNTAAAGPVGGNKVDKKAPGVWCASADGNWHAADVSIACTASDGGSGVSPEADEGFSLSTNVAAGTETSNASTGSKTVSDAVGNTATAGPVGGNKVDRKGPGVSCDSADGSWHAADVSIDCTATDGGSGVAPQADEGFSLSTNVAAGTETSNAQTSSKTVSDAVGNTATAGPVGGNKVDKKAPGVSCGSADGTWHAANVSIACTASDGGSGVSPEADEGFSLSTSVTAGTETSNAQTSSKTVSDAVGNTATAGPVGGNKVDRKGPGVSCDSADGSWHAADVTVACTAADGGSGVAPESDESFSLSTDVSIGTETNNAQTNSKTVSDAVGNTATAGPVGGNKVDKKAPGVWCGSADGNWHASDVSIGCTAGDGGSGVSPAGDGSFSLSTNVPAGTETGDAQTNSRSVSDAVGNTAAVGGVGGNKVDKKAPGVSCDSADGSWHAADVTIACTASDGGSGVTPASDGSFSLSTNVAGGTQTSNAPTNSKNVSDAVGNSAAAGPVGGNKVDKKGPVVTVTCPTAVKVGSSASAGWSASDGAGSGVAAPDSGSVALATGSIGTHTASVPAGTATDNVGNTSGLATCQYSVQYDSGGFYQPVDNGGVFNKAKAGSAIPVKFSLDGAPRPGSNTPGLAGAASAFTANPTTASVACPSATGLVDLLEELSADSTSGLKYDAAADQWVYVWKTTTGVANSCRQLKVALADGTTMTANFQFTK